MFKRCKVVLLRTLKEANITIIDNRLAYSVITKVRCNTDGFHIYIVSDDEIKEGDWYLREIDNTVTLANINSDHKAYNCKKIIASTDNSLTTGKGLDSFSGKPDSLPRPSDSFISKYIEEYNKGNVITDVMVEYDTILCGECAVRVKKCECFPKPKINPKDNTITIKKIKDSWNREEVEDLIKKLVKGRECKAAFMCYTPTITDVDKWLKENL